MGVFHILVVYLSSPEAASLQWELCISCKAQYRNKVTFFVGDDLDEVTLIERPQVIEVWIDREDDATKTDCCRLLSAVCKEVRSTLDAALTHVKSSKKSILRVHHQAAVYYERLQCDPAPHYALPRGNGPPRNAMCSFSNYPYRLGPYQRIWFGEVSIIFLIAVCHPMCLMAMLTDWLNTSDASWSSLVDALRHPIVGQRNLAADLERKYLTQAGGGQSTDTL